MFLGAFAFFRYLAGAVMLLAGLIALPIERVKEFWASLKIKGALKAVLIIVLFFVAVFTAPSSDDVQRSQIDNLDSTTSSPYDDSTPSPPPTASPSPTPKPTVVPTSEPSPDPTVEPTPEPAAEPTSEPTPEPTLEPTPEPTPVVHDYVLNTNSKRFHRPTCNSVDDIKPVNRKDYTGTRERILKMGYEPCGRCHP